MIDFNKRNTNSEIACNLSLFDIVVCNKKQKRGKQTVALPRNKDKEFRDTCKVN